MPHYTPLITTIVVGLVMAFVLGAIANRLRVSPIVGFLLAGVAVGPHTPGLVVDQALVPELAELGVILLMFGVGLHFSLKDLLSVKAIALPGAVAQIAIATGLGMALAWALGWPVAAGLVFGLALSVASTVVLLRALQERRQLQTERGRIAVGWLVVEDLVMVLTLVLLPPLARLLGQEGAGGEAGVSDGGALFATLALTTGKIAAFVLLMLVVGRRVVPWILNYAARTGSRELFRLSVLALALGVAYGAAELFGVSFALGAFLAGMMLHESELSQRAAEESLPLRDAFAVLFFVSVGMLFDPAILIEAPWPVIATFAIIVAGKSLAALLIVLAFRHPVGTAFTIAASLAQIGEFSFILAALGVELNLLPPRGQELIVAGAILSILANPLCFVALDRLKPWLERRDGNAAPAPRPDAGTAASQMTGHAVVVGVGRVGSLIARRLSQEGKPFVVVEERLELAEQARSRDIAVIHGNAVQSEVIAATNLPAARWLFVAIPEAFEAGQIIQQARTLNPRIMIIARAHSDSEVEYLSGCGADYIVMGEREIAHGMIGHVFGSLAAGVSGPGRSPEGRTGAPRGGRRTAAAS